MSAGQRKHEREANWRLQSGSRASLDSTAIMARRPTVKLNLELRAACRNGCFSSFLVIVSLLVNRSISTRTSSKFTCRVPSSKELQGIGKESCQVIQISPIFIARRRIACRSRYYFTISVPLQVHPIPILRRNECIYHHIFTHATLLLLLLLLLLLCVSAVFAVER